MVCNCQGSPGNLSPLCLQLWRAGSVSSLERQLYYTSLELELPQLLAAELPCNCTTHLCPPRSIMEPKKYVPNARIRVCKLKIKQGMYWTCQAPGKTYFFLFPPHLVIPHVRACQALSQIKHVSNPFSSVQRCQVNLYLPCRSLEELHPFCILYMRNACPSLTKPLLTPNYRPG